MLEWRVPKQRTATPQQGTQGQSTATPHRGTQRSRRGCRGTHSSCSPQVAPYPQKNCSRRVGVRSAPATNIHFKKNLRASHSPPQLQRTPARLQRPRSSPSTLDVSARSIRRIALPGSTPIHPSMVKAAQSQAEVAAEVARKEPGMANLLATARLLLLHE